ncbi:hypothetical protein [Gracilibacillus sp. YIM 98692]|uniref:hypothetical protein n=1 Tax=Gracilibacillus sp. YIM 98692 TaxID=2663532 RepID=UPI0013D25817|nr:hypothetical protein [Gracilibacillus sp. YIM 98692]
MMMKIYIALLFLFVLILTACSSEKTLKDWEIEIQDRPINIAYVGVKPNLNEDGVTFISYSDGGDYEALWIDGSEFENFTSKEAIADIKEILNEGKVVVFLTKENAFDTIAPELGINGYEESDGGSAVQHGFYLWDENGEVRIGFVLGDKGEKSWTIFLENTIQKSRNIHK